MLNKSYWWVGVATDRKEIIENEPKLIVTSLQWYVKYFVETYTVPWTPWSKMTFCQFFSLQITLNSLIFHYVSNKGTADKHKYFGKVVCAIRPSVCILPPKSHTLEDSLCNSSHFFDLMITGNFQGDLAVEKEPHHSSTFVHEVEWVQNVDSDFYSKISILWHKRPCLSSPFYTS